MDLRHTPRLFLPAHLRQDTTVTTSADQAHYLQHVMRLREGDIVRVFNKKDGEYRAEIAGFSKKGADLAIHATLRALGAESDLWLCCAPIKKAHFDNMVEKATELGVSEIQPILTHRTQIREVNADRIYGICREASEQSERLSIPAVGLPVSLTDLIDLFPIDRALIVCAEWGDATPIHTALHSEKSRSFKKAAVVTGPEGGFSAEELELLRNAPNALFVRLGPRILRADTAAIAALTCWQAVSGDWNAA